jgi:hypothetical protein
VRHYRPSGALHMRGKMPALPCRKTAASDPCGMYRTEDAKSPFPGFRNPNTTGIPLQRSRAGDVRVHSLWPQLFPNSSRQPNRESWIPGAVDNMWPSGARGLLRSTHSTFGTNSHLQDFSATPSDNRARSGNYFRVFGDFLLLSK